MRFADRLVEFAQRGVPWLRQLSAKFALLLIEQSISEGVLARGVRSLWSAELDVRG